jgi:hypothetical protein
MIVTDEERSPDGLLDRGADDPPHTHRNDGGRWAGILAHRWPTALGIAVAALTAYGMDRADEIVLLSPLVVLMALVYVGSAAVDRRWFAWVVLFTGLPLLSFIPPTSGIDPSVVLLIVAAGFLAVGTARGLLRRPGGLSLQAAGMLVFGAGMLVALYVAPELGAYLVAVGLLGHGAWDAVHFRLDRVVARSYAEFCAVLDLLVGATILIVLFVR